MAVLAQREYDVSNLTELKRQLESRDREVNGELRAISGFWPIIAVRAETQVLRIGRTALIREPMSCILKIPANATPGDEVEFIKASASGTITLQPDSFSGINGAAAGTAIGYTTQGRYRFRYDGFGNWWR